MAIPVGGRWLVSTRTVRTAITTILGTSPGASGSKVQVSHELVPMREEIYSPESLKDPSGVAQALQKVQRHVAETTQSARSLPVLGGAYFPNVALTSTPTQLAHGLQGGVTVAWIVARLRNVSAGGAAVCVEETAQDVVNGRVSFALLPSGATATADIWVFPQPSLTR